MKGNVPWPSWVYGDGTDPDYRFSFANERTFLAWIRTSLGLLAAGVALDVVDLSIPPAATHALATLFVTLSVASAAAAWARWAWSEHAMRQQQSLPSLGLATALLVTGLMIAGLLLVAIGL